MAYDGKHRFNRTQLILSAAWRPRWQFADLLDLYFGLSCNRYKELRGSGFPLEPVAGEARVLIPALLVHSTSILAPSKVYLSFHPSIRPCICPSLPPWWSLLYCHKEGPDQPPFSVKKKSFWSPLCIVALKKGMNQTKPQWKALYFYLSLCLSVHERQQQEQQRSPSTRGFPFTPSSSQSQAAVSGRPASSRVHASWMRGHSVSL